MFLLGAALLSTLIIFSLSVFYFVNRTESEAWRSRQSEATRNAAGSVAGFIQRMEDALILASLLPPDLPDSTDNKFDYVLMMHPALREVVLTDAAGRVIASAPSDQPILARFVMIPQSRWFLQAKEGQHYLGNVQLSVSREPYLIMALPTPEDGVVAARVRMDVLWDVVRDIRFGDSGRAYVITRQGKIVAHTNTDLVIAGVEIRGRPELSSFLAAPDNEWFGMYTNFEGNAVVGASTHIPGTDWLIVTEMSQREAFATSRLAVFVLGAEAFLLMLLVYFTVARYVRLLIVRPMEQLRVGTDRIGQGDLDYRIDTPSINEIGQLASAFNLMAADLEKQQDNLQKAIAYEYESQRARELDILLKASEATSSSLDFNTVMHTLASQLLEINRFESCFIAEWDKETDTVVGRIDHSRIFWREGKRESYSMHDYPRSNQVLLTGIPIILQGDFQAEEKQWMEELKRTAVIILALFAREKVIGLVEIASIEKNKLFDPSVLEDCQKILSDAASWVAEPLAANEPKKIFEVEQALLQATEASVCSFSEWDRSHDCILTTAVYSNTSWEDGQGPRFNPNLEIWRDALYQGKTSVFENSKGDFKISSVVDNPLPMTAESLIVFPLQKGDELIGVIELYDFNHATQVTPEQITLLRTIADKASYSIENARLLAQTQGRLEEQIALHTEKEVLLKEVHHRVKNNLQIISSLLNLQAGQVTDAPTLQALGDSQARVRSMALIHEKLYQSKSLASIDFGGYVRSLATDLFRSYRRNLTGIRLDVQVDEVTLDLDHAVSCGLILNELMTNALKYAFPDGRDGTVRVELRANPGNMIRLRVADDGVGIPADFDIPGAKSLGLQLVHSLVGQLDGTIELDRSEGTAFWISFEY